MWRSKRCFIRVIEIDFYYFLSAEERVALTDLCKLDANDLPNSHSFHLNNEWKINLKVIIDRYQSIEFVVLSLFQPPIKKVKHQEHYLIV
jgi:hypothetical protein